MGKGEVDLQAAGDHAGEQHGVEPVREANDAVMPLHAAGRGVHHVSIIGGTTLERALAIAGSPVQHTRRTSDDRIEVTMRRTRFLGTGFAVPDRVVTNEDLSARMDTSDEWIRTRTGIGERRSEERRVGKARSSRRAG